jgi:outer membrane biosynthesis protein TonB
MKRVLLSLIVIGAISYPAYTYFAANDAPNSDGSAALGQVPMPASPALRGIDEAQAAEESGGLDAMASAAPNSPHAITVEQAPPPATAEAPSQTPVQAPASSSPPQAAAEAPSQAPAQVPSQAEAPASLPPAPETTQPPPVPSARASQPDQPAFMKVTSPTSIREGPSVSSAIIGIAHPGAEAQVVSRDSDWVQIIDPGSKKTGWINQSFLERQAEPASQPASKEEVEAALAAPAPSEGNDVSGDRPAYAKSRSNKHSWKHRRHRQGFALGFFRRRFW